jgi:altronate dehydratase
VPDALVVSDQDNVATALSDLTPGLVTTNRGERVAVDPIKQGHKFAVSPIPSGANVIKYGEVVGHATTDIELGHHVHVHNVADPLPSSREEARQARIALDLPAERLAPPTTDATFMGYHRGKGRAGIRNLAVVVSTVGCANFVVNRIAADTGAIPIIHEQGCLQLGDDLRTTKLQLQRVLQHPNVGGALVVGLGCEAVQPSTVIPHEENRVITTLGIQATGGTRRAIEQGVTAMRSIIEQMGTQERSPVPLSDLLVGTKCGGSDGLSGLTANPALGAACDLLVDAGGGVILSETPGLFGSEPVLLRRLPTQDDRLRLGAALDRVWDESLKLGEKMSEGEMSPGNIDGGLTTLVEKSYGATIKAGSRPFQGFLGLCDEPQGPGAWLLDAPGIDIVTISAEACSGAQIIAFTTGRGSPVGNALAPLVKICSNSETFKRMEDDMDIDAGTIALSGEDIGDVGAQIAAYILSVANGDATKSEELGHREFALARLGSTL